MCAACCLPRASAGARAVHVLRSGCYVKGVPVVTAVPACASRIQRRRMGCAGCTSLAPPRTPCPTTESHMPPQHAPRALIAALAASARQLPSTFAVVRMPTAAPHPAHSGISASTIPTGRFLCHELETPSSLHAHPLIRLSRPLRPASTPTLPNPQCSPSRELSGAPRQHHHRLGRAAGEGAPAPDVARRDRLQGAPQLTLALEKSSSTIPSAPADLTGSNRTASLLALCVINVSQITLFSVSPHPHPRSTSGTTYPLWPPTSPSARRPRTRPGSSLSMRSTWCVLPPCAKEKTTLHPPLHPLKQHPAASLTTPSTPSGALR